MAFQPQPTLGDSEVTGVIDALDEVIILECSGISGAKAVVSGTWVGTIKFEQSVDGSRWDPIGSFSGTTGASLSQTGITTNDIVVFVGIAGVLQIRARFHAFTSGSATVVLRASNGVSNVFVDNLVASNLKTESWTRDGAGVSIGSVNDRLKVDSLSAVSPVPSLNVVYLLQDVKRVSDSRTTMDVDGSSTAQDFDFTPGTGETWYLENITLTISDSGNTTESSFGALSGGLTNGVQLFIKANGTEYTILNLKNNTDVVRFFSRYPFTSEASSFLESPDLFSGCLQFNNSVILKQATGDYIRFRVRDNLTGINTLLGLVRVWRTI